MSTAEKERIEFLKGNAPPRRGQESGITSKKLRIRAAAAAAAMGEEGIKFLARLLQLGIARATMKIKFA